MKKFINIFIAFILVIALTACQKTGAPSSQSDSTPFSRPQSISSEVSAEKESSYGDLMKYVVREYSRDTYVCGELLEYVYDEDISSGRLNSYIIMQTDEGRQYKVTGFSRSISSVAGIFKLNQEIRIRSIEEVEKYKYKVIVFCDDVDVDVIDKPRDIGVINYTTEEDGQEKIYNYVAQTQLISDMLISDFASYTDSLKVTSLDQAALCLIDANGYQNMKRIDTPALAVYASEELTVEAVGMRCRYEPQTNRDKGIYFDVSVNCVDDPNIWQLYYVYADGNVELVGQSKNWK